MANLLETLKTGLDYTTTQIPILPFLGQVIAAAICALILEHFYIKFGSSLSNRKKLAQNFLLITLTTTLIITIVKSSLALSLGLVGALSIVRFRTAVKEPEELAYLFLAIALGLGFGANQTLITIIAFGFILTILYFHYGQKLISSSNLLFVNLSSTKPTGFSFPKLIEKIGPFCTKIDLKRFEDQGESFELSLFVEFKDLKNLEKCLNFLRRELPRAQIACVDQSGLVL